jgi:hypothetical protein
MPAPLVGIVIYVQLLLVDIVIYVQLLRDAVWSK